MKTLFLTIFFIFATVQLTTAQTEYTYDRVTDEGTYISLTKSAKLIGFQFANPYSSTILVGVRITDDLDKHIGMDYRKVMKHTYYPDDIYEVKDGIDHSVHIVIEKLYSKSISVAALIGWAQYSVTYNAKDPYKILSSDGYYYMTSNERTRLSVGVLSNQMIYEGNKVDILSHIAFTTSERISAGIGIRVQLTTY